MRKILLILIVVIAINNLFSCSKNNGKESAGSITIVNYVSDSNKSIEPKVKELAPGGFKELKFNPPRVGEKIVVEEDGLYNPKTNKILIYRESKGKKELLFTIKPETNFYYVRENKGNIYFTIEDKVLNNGLNDLWEVNVSKGTIENTAIKVGGNFKFSPNGIYLCYVYNDYGRYFDMYTPSSWAFIPVVKLLNMENGEKKKYDFENTFLNGEWGAIVDINPTVDRFNIEFSMDGGTLGKGYILLSDKRFYQTK